jgi:hypothetical protein
MSKMVGWESRNELHALWRSEVDTDVVSYREQPHTMDMVLDGKLRRYTPDREDVLADGRIEIVEVKDTFEATKDPDYARKLAFAEDIYSGLPGWSFRIQDRAEIEASPSFATVENIQTHKRISFTLADVAMVRRAYSDAPTRTLGELRALFVNEVTGQAVLAAMMVARIVRIDLCTPMTGDSVVALVSPR